MAVQPGDIINVSRLAWDIYNLGWTTELRASIQYSQFGSEFRHLAENLNILANVVTKAQASLRSHGVQGAGQIRWDPASLLDIVGDFRATLRECEQLLRDNERYGSAPDTPVRSIGWNVLVQPTVDRLRGRIQLHNARIQTVLKPFEIDLLTRVHEDLAKRIGAVHNDVLKVRNDLRSLIDALAPDLKTALDERDALRVPLLPVPPEIEQELEGVFRSHPSCQDEKYPPLCDIADAFLMSLDQSTKYFQPGSTVTEQTPPAGQYLNLMKCLFLVKKMEVAEELVNATPQSHWPSYFEELKERLSHECDRFSRGMVAPRHPLAEADEESLNFWIVETQGGLIDTVTTRATLEDLMEIPLFSNQEDVSKRLQLKRHTGTHDKRYRLVLLATKEQPKRPSQKEKEEIDFDVTTATTNPLYALPSSPPKAPYEMILQANNKIHRLAFSCLEDAFLFQQGITGFKVVDNYFVPNLRVSFVVEGQRPWIVEDASAQIWIQRRLGGNSAHDNSDSPSSIDTPPSPIPISGAPRIVPSTYSGHDPTPDFGISHPYGSPERISAEFGSMHLSSSPSKMSARPEMASGSAITPPMASKSRFSSSPSRAHSPSASGPISTSPAEESTSSKFSLSKFMGKEKKPSRKKSRTFSVGSTATAATSATIGSNFSSTTDTTVTVQGTGGTSCTAVIHTEPLKPMLVLFTRDATTDRRSIVAISIDEKTLPSPQGASSEITILQQSEGKKVLDAKRLYSSTGQWDLLPLCANRRKDKRGFAGAEWRGLRRVSLLFPDVRARSAFGGKFCDCRRQREGEEMECLKKGHMGLLGAVRIYYRKEMKMYHAMRFRRPVHVTDR